MIQISKGLESMFVFGKLYTGHWISGTFYLSPTAVRWGYRRLLSTGVTGSCHQPAKGAGCLPAPKCRVRPASSLHIGSLL